MKIQKNPWSDEKGLDNLDFPIPRTTRKKYRLAGTWEVGVHWTKTGTDKRAKVLYNLPLIYDWLANRKLAETA
ncbi:MAG: hypothetical protein KME35_23710 [Aphanocapsa sp. GSE-SYN-MK-11-07L]|nr:hypothetical protein [Aphanocapsa sp. GSE-SYN-MK-11-07L]